MITIPTSGQKQTPKTATEVQKSHPQVPRDGSGKAARSMVAGGAVNVLPPVAGVSEFWSLLLHPEEGLPRSKTGTRDDAILLDSPYLVS